MAAGQADLRAAGAGLSRPHRRLRPSWAKLNSVQNINPMRWRRRPARCRVSDIRAGRPLHCIPVLVKDEVETSFMPTTYGSAIFKHFHAAAERDRRRSPAGGGAIVLAKANMGEYGGRLCGHGIRRLSQCLRPDARSGRLVLRHRRRRGGQPGDGRIGEDTGGSIRGPASNESLVGLADASAVSRFGLLPSTPRATRSGR